jgi:soluble lytic murein transglycosylase
LQNWLDCGMLRTLVTALALMCAGSRVAAQNGPSSPDSVARQAATLLEAGRPWQATRTLAPLLEAAGTRTPATILLAARAAAGWEGWTTATRLLSGQIWLDREQDGAGRALLARAAVERADPAARAHAMLALRAPLPDRERGIRLLTLARALDRAGELDSAAASYRQVAALLPEVADWLLLRAAGVTADSGTRRELYASVTLPAATPRIRWTEALARDRTGDPAGAARLYDQLGASLTAVRLRMVGADSAALGEVRRDLVGLLSRGLSAGGAREAITLLDGNFAPLSGAEELLVARRAAAASMFDRAVRGFQRAARAARLSDSDRYTYGTVLAGLGRHQAAIAQFETVHDPGRRGQAMYQRARSLFRTAGAARAVAALRSVRDSFPGSPTPAATAGWLLADYYVDQGNDARARQEFAVVGRRFPTTSHGERAAFQAALLAFAAGDAKAAATEFDAIADRVPAGDEATAAAYWSGRAWAEAGDSARARQRWRSLVESSPQSYYVVPAARRLGVSPFSPVNPAASGGGAIDSAAWRRANLLDSLGLAVEARFELDWQGRSTDADAAGLLARAEVLGRQGQVTRALRLAQQAVSRGAPADQRALELIFPLVNPDVLAMEAGAVGLAPLLVASLIRQESAFDPRARSRADARGLMQVMPAVGAATARREKFPEWDPVLLYQPDVNMHIGLRHLADRMERCAGNREAALAAYNAGATPVNRWLERPGTADADVFIDRIPYVETRDYVRRVLYNWARYESIYGTGFPPGSAPGN